MLVRYDCGQKDRFEIETGRHRFNSLFIILDGEYEYSTGQVKKRILPYQPVIFKKGAAFEKRVLHPIEFVTISPAEFSYEGDWCLSYEECDRMRLENSVQHLKRAISEGQPDSVIEHFFRDILLTAAVETTEMADATVKSVCAYMEQNLR